MKESGNVRKYGTVKKVSDLLIPTKDQHGIVSQNTTRKTRPMVRSEWPEGTVLYALPVLTVFGHDSDLTKTMKAYRVKMQEYNTEASVFNTPIDAYNTNVISFRKGQNIPFIQKAEERKWQHDHAHLDPDDYNIMVLEYNQEKGGEWLRQKHVKEPLKPVTEKLMMALLYEYQRQLTLQRKYTKLMGRSIYLPLPKLEVYPNKLQELERDGCKILDFSKNTLRHHRDRLMKAKILIGYENHGHRKPVTVHVNPEILHVSDNFKTKKIITDNQTLTNYEAKKVGYNNVSSRPSLVNNKYRDKGISANAPIRQSTALSSTRPPKMQGVKNSGELQKKITKGRTKNPHSTALATTIDTPAQLAKDLSQGKYYEYTPLHEGTIASEAKKGALHPDDFIELAIQDVFRSCNALMQSLDNVHPGTWVNAYKKWKTDMFVSFTGKPLAKHHTALKWLKIRTVLKEIYAFAKAHPDWKPSYPSNYFDPQRTFKENNSFQYAYIHFKKDDNKIKSKAIRKLEAVKDSRNKTDIQKAREKIRAYIYGECDLGTLHRYAVENLDKSVYQNINQLLLKELERIEYQANA
ncbi:hypothetical protein [Dokdonia sp.]|uniref:hypothetical protein n=1 Tax=Dokdonia sp. TaxID=2024995 RepID=UPI0032635FA4